jgi:phosphoglycerate dehydrogenase-like enzyme
VPSPLLAAVPPQAIDIVREAVPDDVRLLAIPASSGAELAEALRDVTFLIADFDRRDELGPVLPDLGGLEVVQVPLSGTDWIEPFMPAGAVLCNAAGTRDVPVAEWVVAALLGATSGLLDAVRVQHTRRWDSFERDELTAKRVLIVGMGAIGRACAVRLTALGADVAGVARRAREDAEPLDRLPELLPEADVVVLLAPLNEETRGMVDAAFLARLRDGALLVNAGRGGLVDTDALMRELAAGRLRAVLDVVDPEPLPPEHPLWDMPGVAICPHVGGNSPQAWRRAWRFAGDQLARYAAGEPLLNVVARG